MRARAILVAWVLAAQVIAPSLALAGTVRSGCCCAAGNPAKCHCPACSKTRAIEEGQDVAGTCGHDAGRALAPSIIVAAPARIGVRSASAPAHRPRARAATAPPSPVCDVPTPPPLT